MVFHSIRWRILAWNFGLLAATTTVLLVAFHRHERANRTQEADLRLRQLMTTSMGALGEIVPGVAGPARVRPTDSNAQRKARAEETVQALAQAGCRVLVVAQADGKVLYANFTDAPRAADLIAQAREQLAIVDTGPGPGRPVDLLFPGDQGRVLLHRPPGPNVVLFELDTSALEAELRTLAWKLFTAGLALTGLGCTIGWMLAGRSLRPLDRIAVDAEGIAAGDYRRQIDVEDTESELGRLAVVLNDTFGKMNAARDRVTQFTADASHELRTPLTVILSDSQSALRHERSPEEYRQALEGIKSAALRMKVISDGLLELAHGDLAQPVEKGPCDLADLADESVALLARVAKEKGATLEAKLEGAPIQADPARLGRVILNLVMNAIVHNPAGVRIAVATGVVDGQAELTVSDDGRGIPAEDLGHIFERFRRVDPAGSRHAEGAGLGLAIVRQTIEAHGGTIAVTSEVGRGTTFRVRLPLAG